LAIKCISNRDYEGDSTMIGCDYLNLPKVIFLASYNGRTVVNVAHRSLTLARLFELPME
jgi:hypothetical protein